MTRAPHALFAVLLSAALACAGTRPPPAAAVSEPPPGCRPLRATEPGTAADDDLRALAGWLGEARVVALGEGVHGSRTLHRLAHRVFAHLAAEEGFTVYALEIDQAHGARLDAWVQGGGDRAALDALLAERWYGSRIFYDRALGELLVWMRSENERRQEDGRPLLHVAGFDMKQPRRAADAVLAALSAADPVAAAGAEALYERALAAGAFGVFPNVGGFTGELWVPLPEGAAGEPLRVEAELRGRGVGHGEAGIFALGEKRSLGASEIGPGWRRLVLDLARPAGEAGFRLLLFHRGDGTVELTAPRVTLGGREIAVPDLATVAPRPLLMPKLQRMDHAHEVSEADGRRVLRVAADPVLGESRRAAAEAAALVARALPDDLWARRHARLVAQAVEWRVLAERNRDVFLAENLLWLADEAFPGARVVALAHRSHASRLDGRQGGLLAAALGDDYRAVTLLPTSGRYRYFGPVAEIDEDAALVLHDVPPPPAGTPVACLRRNGEGEPADATVYVPEVEPIEPDRQPGASSTDAPGGASIERRWWARGPVVRAPPAR